MMNNTKTTSSSLVSKQEILLFLLGFLSCSLLSFGSFRFQLVSMDQNLAARWSYLITYGLYALFIGISAILFWWQTISLPTWRKIVSIASGFFLYDATFALSFLGGIAPILATINAILLISILIISFSNEQYIKLVAIGFAAELMFPLSYTFWYMYSSGGNAILYQPLATAAAITHLIVRISTLTYLFFSMYRLVTAKTRWHLGIFSPILLINYAFFCYFAYEGIIYLIR